MTFKFIPGWKPDLPDQRDYLFSPAYLTKPIPDKIDLRLDVNQPPIYNQLALGSCTAQAIAALIQFERDEANFNIDFVPSRLFIYYNEREMEGTVKIDAGAMIRDGIKSVSNLGVCPESNWEYDISKFAKKPVKTCYKNALKYTAIQYARVAQDEHIIKAVLANHSMIVLGISLYDSFMSNDVARTGIVDHPNINEKMIGGHAVCLCGYDNQTQRFIVRNSWGTDWGQDGYFTIPYSYILNENLACDLWVITKIKN